MSVTITACMVSLLLPVFYKQVGKAQLTVCEYNRKTYMKSFELFKVTDTEGYTLEDALDTGSCPPELEAELAELTCPEGGTFSVENGQITCTVHGPIGSHDDEESETLGLETLFSNIASFDWRNLFGVSSENHEENQTVTAGTVLVFDGESYVVTSAGYLSATSSDSFNPDELNFLMQFDPGNTISASCYNYSVGWIPVLMNGMVCERNGSTYVFCGSDNTRWEVLPDEGGQWIKLL